jgi:hypothetical protein
MKYLIVLLSIIIPSTIIAKVEIKETKTYDGDGFQVTPKPPMGELVDKCGDKIKPKQDPCSDKKKPIKKVKPKAVKKVEPKQTTLICPPCEMGLKTVDRIEEREIPTYKAHEISILAGYGSNGLNSESGADDAGRYVESVERFYGPIFGLRYTYRLNQDWSVSGEGLTNRTGLFGVGYSFGSTR